MHVIWMTLCCSRQHISGYDNVCRDIITILNRVNSNNIQIKPTLDDYRMAWIGWTPILMSTGPPVWLIVPKGIIGGSVCGFMSKLVNRDSHTTRQCCRCRPIEPGG